MDQKIALATEILEFFLTERGLQRLVIDYFQEKCDGCGIIIVGDYKRCYKCEVYWGEACAENIWRSYPKKQNRDRFRDPFCPKCGFCLSILDGHVNCSLSGKCGCNEAEKLAYVRNRKRRRLCVTN